MKTRFAVPIMLAVVFAIPARADQAMDRHNMVMSHGAQVMPFDQKVAMHMFIPNASGGTLEVMVHNMDPTQVTKVRTHLRNEAARFATGDYTDPTYIHGEAMPGLRGMESELVAVRYSTTPMGAKITFISTDPAAVGSIHRWLAAQASDHGTSHKHCDMKM